MRIHAAIVGLTLLLTPPVLHAQQNVGVLETAPRRMDMNAPWLSSESKTRH